MRTVRTSQFAAHGKLYEIRVMVDDEEIAVQGFSEDHPVTRAHRVTHAVAIQLSMQHGENALDRLVEGVKKEIAKRS